MPLLIGILSRTFRFAVWGALFLAPIPFASAEAPRLHPTAQPRLPFLRRYAKPALAAKPAGRAPASANRRRPKPSAKPGKFPGKSGTPAVGVRSRSSPGGRATARKRPPTILGRGRSLAPNARGRVSASPARPHGTTARPLAPRTVQLRRPGPPTTVPAPTTRAPAQTAPATPPAPPPPYAASPKSTPGAPTRNIQLRNPNDKSDGPRSIKLDMTRPYLR